MAERKRYPREMVADARTRIEKGEKVGDVAESLGVSYQTVYQWVRKPYRKAKQNTISVGPLEKKAGSTVQLTGELLNALDYACKLLAAEGCPFIWFNKDPAKRTEIKENVCSKCANCENDWEVYYPCWCTYFVDGMKL